MAGRTGTEAAESGGAVVDVGGEGPGDDGAGDNPSRCGRRWRTGSSPSSTVPAVDQPQVKDFGFLVAAQGWWREVKRVNSYTLSTPGPTLALPTIVHTSTDPAAAYQLTLQPVVDPVNNALLIAYDLQGDGVRLYPLLAPHLGICQTHQRPAGRAGSGQLGVGGPGGSDHVRRRQRPLPVRARGCPVSPGPGSAMSVTPTGGPTSTATPSMTLTYSSGRSRGGRVDR